MKSKNKKKKKQLKTGQNSWLKSRKQRSVFPISDSERQKLAVTLTGEIFQPMRLHYKVSSLEEFSKSLSELKCIDYDSSIKRWVWLYLEESRSLNFPKHVIDKNNPLILGEFLYKNDNRVVLNVRTFERGQQAVEFFDKYISRKFVKLTHVTICNKLFNAYEVSAIKSLDQYFETTEVRVRNPEEIIQQLQEITSGIDNNQNRIDVIDKFITKLENDSIPELEKLPIHFYDEGIAQLKMQLNTSKTIAYQHWKGNTHYTAKDAIHDLLSGNI